MAQLYSLTFINNSSNAGDVCLYQTIPDEPENLMSLAWFVEYSDPGTQTVFEWALNYNFFWDQPGELLPGVAFSVGESWPTEVSANNMVTLTFDRAFMFKDQTTHSPVGSLYISQDGTIPANTASVGIGMSGAGTFAVQAQPNIDLVFTPHPMYWITFGSFTRGEVLNPNELENAARIDFPPNVYAMTATLNADNTWTIAQAG